MGCGNDLPFCFEVFGNFDRNLLRRDLADYQFFGCTWPPWPHLRCFRCILICVESHRMEIGIRARYVLRIQMMGNLLDRKLFCTWKAHPVELGWLSFGLSGAIYCMFFFCPSKMYHWEEVQGSPWGRSRSWVMGHCREEIDWHTSDHRQQFIVIMLAMRDIAKGLNVMSNLAPAKRNAIRSN